MTSAEMNSTEVDKWRPTFQGRQARISIEAASR
jgi:hypothetical protein